ncbi:MAG: radical SAM protein [Bacteroidales bacterium]
MFTEFHLIKTNEGYAIAYHYPSSTILEINDLVYSLIEDLQNNASIDDLVQKYSISSDTIQEFINSLDHIQKTSAEETLVVDKSIDRITIHVSNDCNLRCTYCYASGGSYAEERKLMTEQTAIDIVHFFVERFDRIGHIVFFGGEPLLNIPIIERFCKEFLKSWEEGKLKQKPSLGIITNGTLCNKTVIDLVNKYINIITISIDGPKELNDKSRCFADGSGSFDKIKECIETLKKETKVKLIYEATLSKPHMEMGINEAMLAEYFKNEFGLSGTIVPDMYEPTLSTQEYFNENLLQCKDENFYLSESFLNFLGGIIHNEWREMCMVGDRIVAVSVDGNLFPCHMNCGNSDLMFGSIYGENIFDQPEIYKYNRKIEMSKKKNRNVQKNAQKNKRSILIGYSFCFLFNYHLNAV